MNRDERVSDADLDALLALGRGIRPAPDVVRARILARARATFAAAVPAADPAPRRARRLALAASVALVMGAAGAGAAVRSGTFARLQSAPPTRGAAPSSAPASKAVSEAGPTPLVPAPKLIARVERPARQPSVQESYAAELALLQRTQVAYAARDFSGALGAAAEHARRFPNGRLAEEREALRVRSLARSGRSDEARRATAAFAARFPRSVLLPRLKQSVGTSE
jgi:hypothetical protein